VVSAQVETAAGTDLAVRRRRNGRVVAGVASGIADHLGVDVFWVRAVFAALTALNGVGVIAYGLLWVFVPQRTVNVADEVPPKPKERQQAIGLLALGLGAAVLVTLLTGAISGWIVGPLAVALVGAAVVWREADEAQRRRWRDGARSGVFGENGRSTLVRIASGVALVALGIGVLLFSTYKLDQIQFALVAVLATLAGVALLTVPLWIKLVNAAARSARCGTGCTAGTSGTPPGPRRCPPPSRWPRGRSRTRSPSRCSRSSSGTARWTTTCWRWCRPRARRWSTPPSTPGSPRSASTGRWRRTASTSS
jgi:phage shock protein PspC (stress-responsive transcriptional regulator)